MRVFDCFLFHDEWELLELRLHTLREVVTDVLVVEGTRTHSGRPRAPQRARLIQRFLDFPSVRVTVCELPDPVPDRWFPERMQRNGMATALAAAGAQANDLVLMSDCDEIPDPALVASGQYGTHWQRQALYYLNAMFPGAWPGTIALPYAALTYLTPAGIRAQNGQFPRLDGGWHFSYQGGVERMRTKLRSFGHHEYDTPAYHDALAERMRTLSDPFGREVELTQGGGVVVPLDDTFPRYLREHPERFAGMIADA